MSRRKVYVVLKKEKTLDQKLSTVAFILALVIVLYFIHRWWGILNFFHYFFKPH